MPEFPEILAFVKLIEKGKGFPGSLKRYQSLKVCPTVFSSSSHSLLRIVLCSDYPTVFIAWFRKTIV
jgi:hypothetical protein